MTNLSNKNNLSNSIGSILGFFSLITLIYFIVLVRKYFKNHCVKCGKQFWTWNPFDGRKACFSCRAEIDKK